ncbi:MAG: Trk system potassium transporter TrkA [Ruminococcaceae bacterium]|nr:Trk system potassium transporter TrkA [Oscillospiraceae bacterium]
MKIIIVGCGKVGSSLAEQLSSEGHDLTLVDTNPDILNETTNTLDVMTVVGHGASYNVLIEAGIETADLLIAVTASDELNLLCCLTAKKAGNSKTIARVRNPIYNKELSFFKEELGLAMIINPELATATEIARILRFPSAIKIDTFAKGRVEILEFEITRNSKLNNLRLSDLRARFKCDVLICCIQRGDDVIIPVGTTMLYEHDIVSMVAPPKVAAEFFKKAGILAEPVKNTIIVGGGKISYYLAHQLLHMGIHVKIIEQNKKRCEELSELLPEAMIIWGDGTDQNTLLSEGLESCESFVSLTNLDEENIMLSLYVKNQSNAKVITKIKRQNFDVIINKLDLGSIVYPKFITSDRILQYVRAMQNSVGSNVETLYKIVGNKVEALEFRVTDSSPVIGIPLQDLNIRKNILISCINRNGKIIIPKGSDVILPGDTVIVTTTLTGLTDLGKILK